MTRLYRPHIPLEVRCRVALRQLGELWPDEALKANEGALGDFLARLLSKLAELLGCKVSDLRLDHNPPLAARPRFRRGLGRKTYYQPPANDPDHLAYRPHGPEFAGSHLIKTNIRGDHGQHPDRVLIKRERQRREKRPKKRGQSYWAMKRKLQNRPQFAKGRPLKSASRWPKGRKISNRRKR
jgi:hypothetical protein